MNTWWCAIDRTWSSYIELKRRSVVAQGWPAIGDLRSLIHLRSDPDAFKQTVVALGDVAYGGNDFWDDADRKSHRAPAIFWNLLNLNRGDLVVALEGTTVRGICQLPADARFLYRHDRRFHYAQSLECAGWADWSESRFGFTPTAPAQSVHGVKRLAGERDAVVAAWERAGEPPEFKIACWVNVDIPTRSCKLHVESCDHVARAGPSGFKGIGQLLRDGGWYEFVDRVRAEAYCAELSAIREEYRLDPCVDCT